MSDLINLAFGPLDTRAEAEAAGADRISLRDFVVDVEIGAFEVERGVTQRLKFSAVLAVSSAPRADDDVDGILSYDSIANAIRSELAVERLALLETLADRIAARLLAEPMALKLWLRIEKLDREPGDLGVEVVRVGQGARSGQTDTKPFVVYLGDLSDRPDLAGRWLGFLASDPAPVLICGDTHVDPCDSEAARRIALLTRDIAAWRLAALHPASHVAATRTEVDWALSQGLLTVWAPARLLLNTPGAPDVSASGATLAGWLADLIEAQKLVLVGSELPANVTTPAISVETETLRLD